MRLAISLGFPRVMDIFFCGLCKTVIPGYPTALTLFIFDSFTNLSSDLIMNSVTSLSVSLNNFLLAGFCLHFSIMPFRDCLIGYDLKVLLY